MPKKQQTKAKPKKQVKTATAPAATAMVRVRMLTGMAGTEFVLIPGEIVERPESVAREWCAAGIAEAVR